MKKLTSVSLLLIIILSYGCLRMSRETKPTIILTAFGTSVPEARKVFDYIDQKTKKNYPNYEVRWAFTSSFIRKKLKKQGTITFSLSEVIDQLKTQKVTDIVIQSLHVVPGQEFKEISQVDTTGLNVSIGTALLTTDDDIKKTITAISDQIAPDCQNIVVGHGNDHYPEYNQQLIAFDKALKSRHSNAVLCSVEGKPGSGFIEKLHGKNLARVNFIPLMIVAGDHIMNDVMGEEDSWKSMINAKTSTFTTPLGYNDKVLDIYFEHIDTALEKLKE